MTDGEIVKMAADERDADAIIEECKSKVQEEAATGAGTRDKATHEAEIERLARLCPIEYDAEREAAADRIGCRVSTLDKEVSKKRGSENEKAVELCADTEPCAEPVDVAALLDQVRATITRFIVCEASTATAVTLWIGFTWVIEHVQVAPLAVITAPEKGCGKTQLLDIIGRLSRRGLFASNISPAATFRVIEAKSPTLLIDEADAFLRDSEELRGIINSGHTRASAYVIRTVGDDHQVRQFSTWGAKAIAGIGRLSETIMSRAIVLTLRRKLKEEKVERIRYADVSLFEMLASKLARFGLDHGAAIGRARPELPNALGDRQQDNWEPLFAIADFAGGAWPQKAREAAMHLTGADDEAVSTSEELLADIRNIFDTEGVTRISMAELLGLLTKDETAPWATWDRGKPMTMRQLGTLLKEFKIRAVTVSISPFDKPKGFKREQFEDAWARYGGNTSSADTSLPPVTRSPCNDWSGVVVTEEVTEEKPAGHMPDRSPDGRNTTDGKGDHTQISRSPAQSPENQSNAGQGDQVTEWSIEL